MIELLKENLNKLYNDIAIVITVFLTFLTPIAGLFLIVGCFVLFDTLFAIITTIKLNGYSSYKSNKLFNIVPKTFFYLSTIILFYIIDVYLLENEFYNIKYLLSKTICIFWIYIEVKSIDETSMKRGNRSFWVILKEVIGKLKEFKKDLNEIK